MLRYRALATDYDGTLATQGVVPPATWEALDRFKATGRSLVLVTGRELAPLLEVCPGLDRFDLAVLENGAVLYRPADGQVRDLAPRPPDALIAALQARGVAPVSVGRVIVATWEPHRAAVEQTIADLGLDLRVIPNKRALMILPPGIDKASGLLTALQTLGIPPSETIGIGDAENDAPLLHACALGVAVANATEALKAQAHLVTQLERGEGVAELIGRILDGRI